MYTTHSSSTSKEISAQTRDSDYNLLTTQQGNINGQELSIGISEDTDWLLYQFNSLPFLLYKYWLILNFAVTLVCEYFLIRAICASYADLAGLIFDDQRMYASLAVGFMFFLYGCCEMLFVIKNRHSKIAQQATVKFQYHLVGSIMALIYLSLFYRKEPLSPIFYYGALSAIIHLIGGFAVLRAFKKNHPLVRQEEDDENKDFLQQNKAIEAEVSKYEAQLSTWPFVIYSLWLKAVVIFEISLVTGYIFIRIAMVFMPKTTFHLDFYLWIELSILCCLNAYSCFKVEEAIRTKSLTKSKRTLVLLKICNVLSIVTYIIVAIDIYFNGQFQDKFKSSVYSYLWWLACIVLPPVVTLIGAAKAGGILEERENFVKVSSFTQSSYL